ncbi:HNH endonuclease [Variovorax sp. GT1P44]|uniref:HNH endonuclease n=1 Tax=Variovorax sp. GT1P44 TaxID=3443742 RepID=UPI003F454C4B
MALAAINPTERQLKDLRLLFERTEGFAIERDSNRRVRGDSVNSCSKIGGLLTAHLAGTRPTDLMMWVGFLAKDSVGNETWHLRPQVRTAIQRLGWFGPGPNVMPNPPPVGTTADLSEMADRFALVQVRTEQADFRRAVFLAYGGRCAVTGCAVPEVLEAAHLHGSKWRAGMNTANDGVLLRRDIHALYDCGLVSFSSEGAVVFHECVLNEYGGFHGRMLGNALA